MKQRRNVIGSLTQQRHIDLPLIEQIVKLWQKLVLSN
ncbi:Uncharacterised protein [Vibrio cholerae]|nr:Uncharacterised protein [Vibrio cholerae]